MHRQGNQGDHRRPHRDHHGAEPENAGVEEGLLERLALVVGLLDEVEEHDDVGGWLGGRLYVATGSYDLVWGISIGLAVFAALLNVPVREEPVARLRAVPEGAP